tara:strand:- start:1110 stop:2408 length:1299 start_codon:yes stop_codon:yes gene_type:complete
MANKLNFSAQGAPARPLKKAPDRYRVSPGRPNISQSDGVRPAFPLMPYTHLPESYQDINTQDWVVIPKGRIVSAITSNNEDLGDGTDYYGVAKGIMGLMVPANGGVARTVTSPVDASTPEMPINYPIGVTEHDVYQDMRGENLNYDMRNKNWGLLSRQLIKIPAVDTYEYDIVMGLTGTFVPVGSGSSEGGAENITGTYSATIDLSNAASVNVALTFATYSAAYTGAAFGSITSITIDAAATVEDTEWSVAGNGNLTFKTDESATAAVVVTFVYDLVNVDTAAPTAASDTITDLGYESVEKEYSFYTFNSEAGEGLAGTLLKSDYYGNFMPLAAQNIQYVGRLMGVDYRFGKDLLDTVQTVYEESAGSRVAGTGTKGVPQFLYDFAYNAISASLLKKSSTWAGEWPSSDPAEKILEFCNGGVFGEAWIQLDI